MLAAAEDPQQQPQAESNPPAAEAKVEEAKQADGAESNPLNDQPSDKTGADSDNMLGNNTSSAGDSSAQEQAVPKQNMLDPADALLFKASDFPQPPELQEFLKEKMANPFNKYCIDCKKNQTTHALIWLGIFVCQDCAGVHRHLFGCQSQNYIKEMYKDHWDDYQLRSIQVGGNKPFFEVLKEYGIENEELMIKHRHACVNWYRKSHVAKMDGINFYDSKPPKDWNERLQLTKSQLAKNSVQWGENLKIIGGHIKTGAVAASEKAKTMTQKAKEKEISQKMGSRLSMMFKKKGNNSIVEPPVVDDTNNDAAVLEKDQPSETKL